MSSRSVKLMAGSVSYSNATIDGNALYRDSNSNTYVVIEPVTAPGTSYIRLAGFDFSNVPSSAIATSCVVRIKVSSGGNGIVGCNLIVAINKSTSVQSNKFIGRTASIYEVDITSNWSKIDPSEFYVQIPTYPTLNDATLYTWFYGMDIQVEYDLPVNKVVYGTTVLVDLTEDTVTPDDLSEGVTAHDKSGGLITGTNQRGIMVIRDSSDSHGGTVRTITSGEEQVGGMTEADLKNFVERNAYVTDIDWPEGLTKIGGYAFAGLYYFAPSSLPSGVTSIGSYAFYQCQRLSIASLPNGITVIGGNAFTGCSELSLSSLPDSLTTIGSYAFQNCSRLALSSLPSGLTTIGDYAFASCTNIALTSLPNGITKITNGAFTTSGIAISTLPSGVTSIGSNAFNGCSNILSISCDGVITTLSGSAFTGTTSHPMSLASASFPNMALTSTLSTVFGTTTAVNACQQLAFCDIGSTVGIAANAFANCYALQTLVLRKTASVCSLSNVSAFLNTPMRGYNSLTGTVYVPQALIESYKTATNWSTLYNNGTVTFAAIEGSQYERE